MSFGRLRCQSKKQTVFKACHLFSLNINMHKTEDQFDIIQRVKSTLKILLIAVAYALFLIFSNLQEKCVLISELMLEKH